MTWSSAAPRVFAVLLAACGARSSVDGSAQASDGAGGGASLPGGEIDQRDPTCVPTDCIAPCDGEVQSAVTQHFVATDVSDAAPYRDGAFLIGNTDDVGDLGGPPGAHGGYVAELLYNGGPIHAVPLDSIPGGRASIAPARGGGAYVVRAVGSPAPNGIHLSRLDPGGGWAWEVDLGVARKAVVRAGSRGAWVVLAPEGTASATVCAWEDDGALRWSTELVNVGSQVLVLAVGAQGDGAVAHGSDLDGVRLAHLASDGAERWSRVITATSGIARLAELAVAPNGDVVAFGRLDADWAIDLGRGTLVGVGPHAWLARYGADGDPRWVRAFPLGAAPRAGPGAVAVDRAGHVIVATATEVLADLEGNPLDAAPRSRAVFVQKLDDCGNTLWSRTAAAFDRGRPVPYVGVYDDGRMGVVVSGLEGTERDVAFGVLGP